MERRRQGTYLGLIFLVWISRLIVGLTFVVSGWSKSIDPWGFIYKVEEYYNVWGLVIPREITIALAVILSVAEFTVGVLLALGLMRRAAAWLAAAFMVFMLPLTAYIAVANPVSDCGCFGDFLVISNTATLLKNIVLSAFIVVLLLRNDRVAGLYCKGIQWLVVVGAMAYSCALAFIGYRYQPLVDFRRYPVGSELYRSADDSEDDNGTYYYEKDGHQEAFDVDALPDSTWTFVRAEFDDSSADGNAFTVFDGDEDVTSLLLDTDGDLLILAVTDPGLHYLTRARLANELYRYVAACDGDMFAFVAAEGDDLESWKQLALPEYPVFSVEDTSLKELVRGDAGLVYLHDGEIIWKRNLTSVGHDAIRSAAKKNIDLLNDELNVDMRGLYLMMTFVFIIWLIIVFALNYPDRILGRYLRSRSTKNS